MFDLSLPLVSAAASSWLVLMGLVIGSFLNVVIARVPHGQSIVRPRSRCPSCGHAIPWFENIPVVSWLALRGRCSSCRAPISWRYPAVELLTGCLFALCLVRFGWTWSLVQAIVLVTLLIPLTFIDLEHWILPFELTRPGIALGVLTAVPLGWDRARDAAIGAAAGFLAFWALEWLGRKIFGQEALGGGDKYLLALLGAFLGYKALLGVIFLSSLQGSVVGLLLKGLTGRAGPAPRVDAEPQASSPPPSAAVEAAAPPQPVAEGEEDEWVPGPSNLPFGPWLALAGAELLLLGPWLSGVLPHPFGSYLTGG